MVRVQVDPSCDTDQICDLKCVLVGDAAVGKTSLIVSYTTNGYPKKYTPTAFDNYSVLVRVDNQPIRLQLCDTAGQAGFDSLRPFTYPDTDVFMLCFNVMIPSTLRSITNHWIPEISKTVQNAPMILVGTQCDLRASLNAQMCLRNTGEKAISETKAQLLSEELDAEYHECSALTQQNLKEVFDAAILLALKKKNNNNSGKNGKKQQSSATSHHLMAAAPQTNVIAEKEAKKVGKFREGFRRFVTLTKRIL